MKRLFAILIVLALLVFLAILLINIQVGSYSSDRIYDNIESVPSEDRVAIVLGARVGRGGIPSNTLYDRVFTGVELYRSGKTRKLLMSGGNEEPAVMKRIASELGVPEADIVMDELGLRTLGSCGRAKQVFRVENAIVVTQDYHLSRSIYLCQNFGVDTIGVNSKRRDYDGERYAWVREYLSRVKAWYDINFSATSG